MTVPPDEAKYRLGEDTMYRRISVEQLKDILDKHVLWVKTNHKNNSGSSLLLTHLSEPRLDLNSGGHHACLRGPLLKFQDPVLPCESPQRTGTGSRLVYGEKSGPNREVRVIGNRFTVEQMIRGRQGLF